MIPKLGWIIKFQYVTRQKLLYSAIFTLFINKKIYRTELGGGDFIYRNI